MFDFDIFYYQTYKAERDEARALLSSANKLLSERIHDCERLSKLNATYAESARRSLDCVNAVLDVATSYKPDNIDKLQNNKALKSKLAEAQRVIETVLKVAKLETI